MLDSLKLKYVASNACKIADLIYGSQGVLRHIHYLSNDPMANKTINGENQIITQPDISILFEDSGIEMIPFDEKTVDESTVKILLNPIQGDMSESESLEYDIYTIDIICNIKNLLLKGKGQWRDFNIAYEISKLLDKNKVAGLGMVKVLKWKRGKLDKSHTYLTLFIRVNNMAVKEKYNNG